MHTKIIYVGSFVSFEDSKSHYAFSQASNLFQKKFIDFIKPAFTISLIPVFINFKKTFSYDIPVKFVNNQSFLKNKMNYLYRLIADTIEAGKLIARQPVPNVFFYNLDYHNFLVVILAKFILKKKVYIVVADYGFYKNNFINKFFNSILRKIDGTIVLNSNIRCNNNTQLLPGLIYEKFLSLNPTTTLNKNTILSGSLGLTTGLELALEFFSKNPGYTLYITGKPFRINNEDFLSLIDSYSGIHSNIHFLGLLEYENYVEILDKCDVALSLRNPEDEEHDYNFPSKILEYLSKSKMVISTKRYPDVGDDILFYSNFNSDSLSESFKAIYSLSPAAITEKRKKIYTYLNETFTEKAVLEKVNKLLQGNK